MAIQILFKCLNQMFSTWQSWWVISYKISQFNISEKSELLVKNLRAELKDPDCVVVNWETPLTDTYTFQYQVIVQHFSHLW